MKITVQSIHFDADQKLIDYINVKISKLDTFFDRIIDGQVYLKLEKESVNHENKVVEVKLNVPNEQLIVKERGQKFEEAVDIAADVLKRQIKRYKEKQRGE